MRSNKELSEKVSVASRLQADNIHVAIITSKNKEKDDDKEEFKAKRVEKLKITANFARNDVSPKETKAVYLRILEPDGAALYNLSTGGGTFTVDGQEAFLYPKAGRGVRQLPPESWSSCTPRGPSTRRACTPWSSTRAAS